MPSSARLVDDDTGLSSLPLATASSMFNMPRVAAAPKLPANRSCKVLIRVFPNTVGGISETSGEGPCCASPVFEFLAMNGAIASLLAGYRKSGVDHLGALFDGID